MQDALSRCVAMIFAMQRAARKIVEQVDSAAGQCPFCLAHPGRHSEDCPAMLARDILLIPMTPGLARKYLQGTKLENTERDA